MVEYTCIKCNKIFDKKDNFNRHMDRKYSCIPRDDQITKFKKELETRIELLEQQMKKIIPINEKIAEYKLQSG